ncbi:SoxR reducing system RseC family protein [bacterium]|nr:SoxR reducing system RseC family protein [bacterium]RQV92099.1 MAG: hypothetical protein EH221_12525 [bacterium]
MKETGTVVRIEKDDCVIQIEPEGGCSHCSMNSCCQGIGTGRRELTLKYGNMELHSGDVVEIETTTRGFLTAVFLVFIFPLVLSTTAYLIINGQTEKSGLAIGGFFGCLILSEIIIGWIDRLFGRKKIFEPRIVRRLKTESTK